MTPEQIIQELERYSGEFTGIKDRFIHGHNSLSIKREDDPRYRTIVIEVVDLLNDEMGNNKYSQLIYQIFIEGTSNYMQSPTYKSVEDIVSVINSVITRLKRNPDFYIKKEESGKPTETEKSEFKPPDKITLKWLWEHVPPNYIWKFFLILFATFSLGITFASTNLYKSLTVPAAANKSNAIQNVSSSAVKR